VRRDGTTYRYDYQGAYAEKDNITNWNNFELRMYDSRIGRWLGPDPKGQFASPYEGMGNNPVSGSDPTGGFSWLGAQWYALWHGGDVVQQNGGDHEGEYYVVSHSFDNTVPGETNIIYNRVFSSSEGPPNPNTWYNKMGQSLYGWLNTPRKDFQIGEGISFYAKQFSYGQGQNNANLPWAKYGVTYLGDISDVLSLINGASMDAKRMEAFRDLPFMKKYVIEVPLYGVSHTIDLANAIQNTVTQPNLGSKPALSPEPRNRVDPVRHDTITNSEALRRNGNNWNNWTLLR
jgi:RHS repeat-associated protein